MSLFERLGLKTRTLAVLTGVACVILLGAPSALAVSVIPVKTSPLNEISPASSSGYFMWAQNSAAHPKHFDVYLQQGSGARVKLNAQGSQGYSGSISSDGSTAAFQQIVKGQSSVELYDIASHTVSSPPSGVNTKEWEWGPSIDGNFLLFSRNDQTSTFPPDEVILVNLSTHAQTVIASSSVAKGYTDGGEISGDFVSYEKCSVALCNVYRFQVSTQATIKVPNPHKRVNYGSSVDNAGTVYYGRSAQQGCGTHARLMKWTPGGAAPSTIFTPPVGQDFSRTFTETTGGGDVLFFDRVKCATVAFDIYKMVGP